MNNTEIAAKAPKTPEQKIAFYDARIKSDTEKRAEQVAILQARVALENLASGDSINFVYGRGENRKTYTGKVLGVADTDKGTRITVLYGEGADSDTAKIAPGDVVSVAGTAAAEGVSSADTDPLATIQ